MNHEKIAKAHVVAVFRDHCLIGFPEGEKTAEVTGRFRYGADTHADFPAVGDWVMASIEGPDLAMIHSIIPRTTVISRKAAGTAMNEQVLAANVDFAFIVTSFNEDFNLRRLERYLALTKQAGVTPVILLNKADLAGPDDDRQNKVAGIANDVPVFRISAVTGEGINEISARLANGAVGVFLGSSGVGKSTILNRLLGIERQATQSIRFSDAKGRHTTSARQMFSLPSGGFVIDTPGIREIQLWGEPSVLEDVYIDVATLAEQCRFRNCHHQDEPGCAVTKALETGELSQGRWLGYTKLQKELAYLKRKQDPEMNANSKRRWKSIHKQTRDILKRKRG